MSYQPVSACVQIHSPCIGQGWRHLVVIVVATTSDLVLSTLKKWVSKCLMHLGYTVRKGLKEPLKPILRLYSEWHIFQNDQTDRHLNPSLMFIELSLHCVKTLELTTAVLLSHSSKVCKSNQVILPDNK